MKDAQVLIDAAKQILHLHMCEQEGLQSGQPSPQQWFEAVDNLSAAIALVESPGSEQEAQVCDATKAKSELPASGSSNVREEELYEALADLVALKNYKDTYGKTAEYRQRQQEGWKSARRAINKYFTPKKL